MLASPVRHALILTLGLAAPLACDSGGSSEGGSGGTDTGGSGSTGIASPCENDDRGDDYMVGLSRMGERMTVEFVDAMPAPPDKGNNVWHLRVLGADGLPADGTSIEVLPWMPDHGHGSPTGVVVTPMDGQAGEFMADPVNLFMAGLWEVTVEVTDADESTDSVVFRFCIDP